MLSGASGSATKVHFFQRRNLLLNRSLASKGSSPGLNSTARNRTLLEEAKAAGFHFHHINSVLLCLWKLKQRKLINSLGHCCRHLLAYRDRPS
jgi:hypothetical protein